MWENHCNISKLFLASTENMIKQIFDNIFVEYHPSVLTFVFSRVTSLPCAISLNSNSLVDWPCPSVFFYLYKQLCELAANGGKVIGGRRGAGVILCQNCVRLSDVALDDFFFKNLFYQKHCK